MKARPVLHERQAYGAGFVEIVVWRVPETVAASEHAFKYRLAYIVKGARIVGYDNERGKGDHRHFGGIEHAYDFVDVATLIEDFWDDVKKAGQ